MGDTDERKCQLTDYFIPLAPNGDNRLVYDATLAPGIALPDLREVQLTLSDEAASCCAGVSFVNITQHPNLKLTYSVALAMGGRLVTFTPAATAPRGLGASPSRLVPTVRFELRSALPAFWEHVRPLIAGGAVDVPSLGRAKWWDHARHPPGLPIVPQEQRVVAAAMARTFMTTIHRNLVGTPVPLSTRSKAVCHQMSTRAWTHMPASAWYRPACSGTGPTATLVIPFRMNWGDILDLFSMRFSVRHSKEVIFVAAQATLCTLDFVALAPLNMEWSSRGDCESTGRHQTDVCLTCPALSSCAVSAGDTTFSIMVTLPVAADDNLTWDLEAITEVTSTLLSRTLSKAFSAPTFACAFKTFEDDRSVWSCVGTPPRTVRDHASR